MKKIYLFLIFIGIVCFSVTGVQAQSDSSNNKPQNSQSIEGLNMYPNPIDKGSTLYITSASGRSMTVTIYNVLGEKVLFKVLIGKELNISSLTAGVYVIKLKQQENTSTRKLVVK
ncbi:T9SS type A sorting domain-containing protein [Aquimarina sp. 2201CG5-10]|uniref:T9SS type A sorting domain-containing protein n=1 Tax=Aquimarina callyspongiae TaxID=3098150 RepID=UPI002AB57DE7|nr:T9SS type A sorting domain-containing protein [Aquimarina sp. 2201CG5-10]MDY8134972.1 T9SS type A sorting domain-containing protein [Aquimarina sp. 2201CG5-10]